MKTLTEAKMIEDQKEFKMNQISIARTRYKTGIKNSTKAKI